MPGGDASSGGPVRVLHVDPDPGERQRVAGALDAAAGAFDVATASDPRSALSHLEGADVDCLVSEYDLPGMDGVELLAAVRETYPDLPVVLFTGSGDEAVASRAISAGVTDYVRKGDDRAGIDGLLDRIREVAEAGRESTGTRYDRGGVDGVMGASPGVVFDSVNDGIVVFDPETGEITEVNEAYHEMLGYDDVETIRDLGIEGLSAIEEGYTGERGKELIREVAETGESETVEWRGVTSDGDRLWLEATLAPAEIGGEQRVLSIQRDVTERRELARTHRNIFENVSDGLVVHDPDTGEITDVNERFCEMNGYDREALIGEDIGVVTAPGEEYSYEAAHEKIEVAREGGPQLFEWRNQRRNGETFPVEVHLSVVSLHGEERVLASVRDISERKRREREYEQIFDGVNESIVIQDPETAEPVDANETFLDRLGYDDVAEVRRAGFEALSATDAGYTRERARELCQRVVETGEPETVEWQQETTDGDRRWIEAKVDSAVIRGEERVLSMQRDVTERKRREETIRALHESTGALQEADTPEAVCAATVTAAREVLDLSMPTCWLHGVEEPGVLTPVAATDEAWEAALGDDGPGEFEPGDFQYEAYETGGMRVYDPSDILEATPLEHAVLIGLGDHGMFGAAEPGVDAFDDVTLDAARILARHARTALDRVERERELRESERRFRLIAEHIDEIVYLANADFSEILYINPAYEEIYGRPVEELKANPRSFVEAAHPDDRDRYEADIQRLVEDVERGDPADAYGGEYRIRRDGEVRWVTVTRFPVENEDGTVDRIVGRVQDVTERRRRERAIRPLQTATERLQTAETPEDVATIAVETASEMLDLPVAICWFHDAGRDRLDPAAATDPAREDELVSGLGPDRYEYDVFLGGEVTEYRPSERTTESSLETGVLLPLGDHGLIAAGSRDGGRADETVIDVARALADHATTALDRVEQAQAVRESERRFRLIAERVDEVIYLAEPDFSEALYVNPAYEAVWGRPVEELYDDARGFLDAVDPRDSERVEADFEAMVEDIARADPRDSYDFEYRIRRPGGEVRWVSATGYAAELSDGNRRFVGIVEDITDRKHREQRLEVFNRVLRHNLRNQLDVIRSHAETLTDLTDDDSHADRIVAAVDELAAMGARARKTDRIMSMEDGVEPVGVPEVLREAIDTTGPDHGVVDVTTDVPRGARLTTNREALLTAAKSALENAIEHADSEVVVAVEDRPEGYTVVIEDDGPGIPEEELAPIETGTETKLRHGRGLGLWQLRWSVDKLSGELSFETDEGTTIRIRVPDHSGAECGN